MKLTHIRLLVTDFAVCFRFYRDVLGFAVLWGEEDGRYADFDAGETTLALFQRQLMADEVGKGELPAEAAVQDSASLIFSVPDVDEAVARLKEQQVEILNEPLDYPEWGIRVAHFRDPSGNLIEINQPLSVA